VFLFHLPAPTCPPCALSCVCVVQVLDVADDEDEDEDGEEDLDAVRVMSQLIFGPLFSVLS